MKATILILTGDTPLLAAVRDWLATDSYTVRWMDRDVLNQEIPPADVALLAWPGDADRLKEQLQHVRLNQPACRCVLAIPPYRPVILLALRLAATGYVAMPPDRATLTACLSDIQRGNGYWDKKLLDLISHQPVSSPTYPAGLNRRERELWEYLANGLTNQQITELMCLSSSRIRNLKTELAQKLSLPNAHHLTMYAVSWANGNRI